jgi:hypothetical protein
MTRSDTADPLGEVRMLLGAAGIEAPDSDLASLAKILPGARRRVDRMYAVDTGDEVTAAVFRAELEETS